MAGGNKERVNLGNVVIAEIVHDADRRRVVSAETIEGRLQLPGRSSRVRLQSGDVVEWDDVLKNIDGSVPVDREIVRVRTTGQRLGSTVSTFNDSEECSEFVQSVTSEMPSIIPGGRKRGETMDLSEHESKDSVAVKGDELRFRVYYGPILASGALVESEQELVRLCRLYNEKALAVDMESYGFLVWCESAGLDNSLVVRGIADFCTNYKEDPPHSSPTDSSASKKEMARRKDWQYPATFRAARLLRDKLLTDVFGWPMSD